MRVGRDLYCTKVLAKSVDENMKFGNLARLLYQSIPEVIIPDVIIPRAIIQS